MKRLFFLSLLAFFVLNVSAQKKVGSLTVMPKVGLSLANISHGNKLFNVTGTSLDVPSNYRAGFTGGAEFEYQFQSQCSLSLGVLYSLQGCHYKDVSNEVHGQAGSYSGFSNTALGLHYIQIPVLVGIYLADGLAVKAGVQPSFLLGARAKYDVTNFVVGTDGGAVYDPAKHVSKSIKGLFASTDVAIPVGISYEYANVVMEARYLFSLSKVEKTLDAKNRCFTFTVGYRLNLLK